MMITLRYAIVGLCTCELTETVKEKRFYCHNPSHSAGSWRWRQTALKKTESLTQKCVCVRCQLNSDQRLGLFCLKGHVRARLDAETTPVDKKRVNSCVFKHPLFWGSSATKKSAQNPLICSLRRAPNVTFSKCCGWCRPKKNRAARSFFKPRFAQF